MAAADAFFVTVLCVIRVYLVYKEVWNPSIGEALVCFAEEENYHDWKAIAVTCAEKDMLLATYQTYLVRYPVFVSI